MVEKKIIKISDLRLYKWASGLDLDKCDLLFKKFSVLSSISFKGDALFWMSHANLIFSLMFFKSFILVNKDLIVLKNNSFYLVKQLDFIDSEALLLSCLESLCRFWFGLFSILADAKREYPDSNNEFDALEYSFLDVWLDAVFAMNEILIILHKKNSKFLFRKMTDFEYNIGVFTLVFIKPLSPFNDAVKDLTLLSISDKTLLINKGILERSFFYKQEFKDLLYSWLKLKIDFKFRIKDLSEEDAIKLFVMEVFMDLDLDTLRFITINPLMDMDHIRKRAIEHSIETKGKSSFSALLMRIAEQTKK